MNRIKYQHPALTPEQIVLEASLLKEEMIKNGSRIDWFTPSVRRYNDGVSGFLGFATTALAVTTSNGAIFDVMFQFEVKVLKNKATISATETLGKDQKRRNHYNLLSASAIAAVTSIIFDDPQVKQAIETYKQTSVPSASVAPPATTQNVHPGLAATPTSAVHPGLQPAAQTAAPQTQAYMGPENAPISLPSIENEPPQGVEIAIGGSPFEG